MYDLEITYGEMTDYVAFNTSRELWNILKPHLDNGFEVTIIKRKNNPQEATLKQ
jgi:hypothetical protein